MIDGGFERDDLFVADIVTEESGEISVCAGVAAAFQEYSFGSHAGFVGSIGHVRKAYLFFYIILTHQEINYLDAGMVGYDEIDDRFFGGGMPQLCGLAASVAREVFQRILFEAGADDVVGAGAEIKILPVLCGGSHLLDALFAD